ncbi:MAG: hypothetical protein EI684_08665 [Candidatus Viridilinea halotolerans]|uniref:Uncharacterized protein n=1 Tax=Candidatus Viridilinea halotolerans TaxID=2491704 RepID=A0A426U1V8_9CHLR|nr:MAG: hypothetical protein EI684_08665 [Candidatus Viridilinea halotolerans]
MTEAFVSQERSEGSLVGEERCFATLSMTEAFVSQERSEGSLVVRKEMLRCAQHDKSHSVPMRSSVPLLLCSSVPLLFCSSAPLLFCSSVPLFFCSSVPLLFCSSVLLLFTPSSVFLAHHPPGSPPIRSDGRGSGRRGRIV